MQARGWISRVVWAVALVLGLVRSPAAAGAPAVVVPPAEVPAVEPPAVDHWVQPWTWEARAHRSVERAFDKRIAAHEGSLADLRRFHRNSLIVTGAGMVGAGLGALVVGTRCGVDLGPCIGGGLLLAAGSVTSSIGLWGYRWSVHESWQRAGGASGSGVSPAVGLWIARLRLLAVPLLPLAALPAGELVPLGMIGAAATLLVVSDVRVQRVLRERLGRSAAPAVSLRLRPQVGRSAGTGGERRVTAGLALQGRF